MPFPLEEEQGWEPRLIDEGEEMEIYGDEGAGQGEGEEEGTREW